MQETDVRDAHRRVVERSALVIDVREPDEWARGHAEGVVLVPLGELDPDRLPRDRPILVLCRSGRRSGLAATSLGEAGLDAVNVVGGMLAWQEAGLPLVADHPGPPEVS